MIFFRSNHLLLFSSSRGDSSSALHSYSKRRFIRPFAPPCTLLTFSPVVVSWRKPGGQWEGMEKAGESWRSLGESPVGSWLERAEGSLEEEIFLNSIVQALVVVVVVVVFIVVVLLSPPFFFFCFLSLFLEESSGKNVVSPLRRWLIGLGGGVELNNFF